jgi:hypothetical protein
LREDAIRIDPYLACVRTPASGPQSPRGRLLPCSFILSLHEANFGHRYNVTSSCRHQTRAAKPWLLWPLSYDLRRALVVAESEKAGLP